jgi:hypothetical protein
MQRGVKETLRLAAAACGATYACHSGLSVMIEVFVRQQEQARHGYDTTTHRKISALSHTVTSTSASVHLGVDAQRRRASLRDVMERSIALRGGRWPRGATRPALFIELRHGCAVWIASLGSPLRRISFGTDCTFAGGRGRIDSMHRKIAPIIRCVDRSQDIGP